MSTAQVNDSLNRLHGGAQAGDGADAKKKLL